MLFVLAAGAAVVYGRVQSGQDAREAARGRRRASPRGWRRARSARGSSCCRRPSPAPRPTRASRRRSPSPEDCGLTFGGTDAYTTGPPRPRAHGRLGGLLVDARGARRAATRAPPGSSRRCASRCCCAPVADPRTGKQVVLATAPVPKLGFVLAVFNLDAVGRSLRESYGGPRGLEFLLTDAAGGPCSPARSSRSAGSARPLHARRDDERAVRERDGPGRRLAGPRRRRPRAGARRDAPAQPPRADDHPRRAAAVPGWRRGSCTGASRARWRGSAARCAARRPTARRRRSRSPGPPRSPRSRRRLNELAAPSARAGGLPRRVRRQPAADVGARRRDAAHPGGQRRGRRRLRLHPRRAAGDHRRRARARAAACTCARTGRRSRSASPRTRSTSAAARPAS